MHISICICTYKRPEWLKILLLRLVRLEKDPSFDYSIVVVDNDRERTAESIAAEVRKEQGFDVQYISEPVKSISLARNKAVERTRGELIAFIDDDEYPAHGRWLIELYRAYLESHAAGIMGPVAPHYLHKAPAWIEKGGFFSYRQGFGTGKPLEWHECATSNALLSREMFRQGIFFNEAFGSTGGEDTKFFWDATQKGFHFVACSDALVYEWTPPRRCTFSWIAARAFRTGGIYAFVCMASQPLACRRTFLIRAVGRALISAILFPGSFLAGLPTAMPVAVRAAAYAGKAFGVCGKLFTGY